MQTIRYLLVVSITLWLSACGNNAEKMSTSGALPENTNPAAAPSGREPPAEAPVEPQATPLPAPAPKIALPKPQMESTAIPREKSAARMPADSAMAPEISWRSPQSHALNPDATSFPASHSPDDEISSYLVKVEANRDIKMSVDPDKPTSGQLKVWIGQPQYEPKTQAGMSAASSVLQTSAPATSAKITPSFPDDPTAFKVKPETSTCQGIDPTGTEVPFTITPTRAGQFRVGASVELYKNKGCEGDALTKTADPITVVVTTYIPPEGLLEIAWSAFKNFFKEILGTLFVVLVVVFRKRLYKLFGLKEET